MTEQNHIGEGFKETSKLKWNDSGNKLIRQMRDKNSYPIRDHDRLDEIDRDATPEDVRGDRLQRIHYEILYKQNHWHFDIQNPRDIKRFLLEEFGEGYYWVHRFGGQRKGEPVNETHFKGPVLEEDLK